MSLITADILTWDQWRSCRGEEWGRRPLCRRRVWGGEGRVCQSRRSARPRRGREGRRCQISVTVCLMFPPERKRPAPLRRKWNLWWEYSCCPRRRPLRRCCGRCSWRSRFLLKLKPMIAELFLSYYRPGLEVAGWGQQISRSRLSPQTNSRTELMIFLFLSVSAVSLARLSWAMMGSQDLMGMQVVSRGQLEMVSRNSG